MVKLQGQKGGGGVEGGLGSKKSTIICTVRKKFEEKYGREASPTIEKCLKELNSKEKVSIDVSFSFNTNLFVGKRFWQF